MGLKELLGDLWTSDIEAKIGGNVVYVWNKSDEKEKDKEPIPKHRVNEMIETHKAKAESLEGQVKNLEATIAENTKNLEGLKKSAEGNAELTAKLAELEKQQKEKDELYQKEKESLLSKTEIESKKFALKEAYRDLGVQNKYLDFVLSQQYPDVAKVEIPKEGKFVLPDDKVKALTETFKETIGETKLGGQQHAQGTTPEGLYTREQLHNLSEADAVANIDKVNKSLAALK